MEPVIDHIQITVKELRASEAFYDKLMPLLGFDPTKKGAGEVATHDFQVVEWQHPKLCFAITSPRAALADENVHRRRPGALHHLAFRASSREEVDKLHVHIEAIGAPIVSAPRDYPEYVPPGYYAFFFKDLEGIKYEIVWHP